MRVLIVEDEATLADTVARGLRHEGMAVDVTGDGASALEKLDVNDYDVVVLDRDLPGVHGDDVCRQLSQQDGRTRILMLTAAGSIGDRVEGLALGADDYLPKPFFFDELVARIRALGRRTAPATPPILAHQDLVLDPARHTVTRSGRELFLARKEFAVLEVLLAARGALVSAEELLERVWDEHVDPFTNTVRVTMRSLRRKLGDPPLIHTVIGKGYRI
jgi:DNA-binding response OmpR family regulator